ncbi:MAG: hypothetical protein D6695_02955 [Planctomycetota bacterium]|nr:MAG: hypothetical protein D6695_02955 [Planctomycetota bacterium]
MWLDRYENLGFDRRTDMVFRDVTVRFTAEDEETQIDFDAELRRDGSRESWAIDNVRVVRAEDLDEPGEALTVDWVSLPARSDSVESISFSSPDHSGRARQIAWLPTRGRVHPELDDDRFAWRATGSLRVPRSGRWEFRLTSDDGSTLRIDNEIVIWNDGRHSPRARTGAAVLDEGIHTIDARAFEWTGVAAMILEWRGPGEQTWSVIPPSAFVESESTDLAFSDVTANSGLGSQSFWLSMSQAWNDLNGDGYLDVIIGGYRGAALLGGADGSFTRSSDSLTISYYQAAMCDVDNDGDLDFLSAYRGLYENDGRGRFTPRLFPGGVTRFSLAIAAPDFDLDGWSDLAATLGWTPVFARNTGLDSNDSMIEYATDGFSALFERIRVHWYYGSILDVDLNDDGYPDIVHTDDRTGIQALLSSPQGYQLEQVARPISGRYYFVFAMCAAADIDNDGDLDLFNGAHPNGTGNGILINDGQGSFAFEQSAIPDCAQMRWNGATFGDLDNDGDLDIVLRSFYNNTVQIRLNDGQGAFETAGTEIPSPRYPCDVRLVDYDNDGDLDLSIVGLLETRLLRNDLQSDQWLKVRVSGGSGINAAAIGTRVDLIDPETDTLLARRDISSTDGMGAGPFWLHFGGVDPDREYIVRAHFASGVVEQRVIPSQVSTSFDDHSVDRLLSLESVVNRQRRILGWHETNQRQTIMAALRAEIRRRGLTDELIRLRDAGVELDVQQLLRVLGARTVREALGDQAGVLTDLTRDPHRD